MKLLHTMLRVGDLQRSIDFYTKVLGMKRTALVAKMQADGWIYRQNQSWVAYTQHIQNGRLQYKEAHYTDEKTGMACVKPYCHITQKGLAKLALSTSLAEVAA